MRDRLFSEIYKYSPIGLVLLDENTELVDVNDYMFSLFELKTQSYNGLQFGNVFGCSTVNGTGQKCGQACDCAVCDLHGGILSVLHEGAVVHSITVKHSFLVNGETAVKWFKFSASSVEEAEKKYALLSFVDVTKEKQYEELLKNELTLDLPSGSVNKHNLISILMDLEKYAPTCSIVSVGIIDMDNFKDINESYGHQKGDEVLNSFSRIARQNIRKQDIIGRFGGEEFIFVFPGVTLKYASKIVKRIHDELAEKFNSQDIRGVSFSAGFMELSTEDLSIHTKEEIIDTLDGYLYQAKKAGKRLFVSDELTVQL